MKSLKMDPEVAVGTLNNKAFKAGEKVKVFRSGYAYKSYIFDVSSKKWKNGKF